MGDEKMNCVMYRAVAESVRAEGGKSTHRGEQRIKEGKGLDPLVDPKGFGVIRRSLYRFDPKGDHFVMTVGPSMLMENRFDTTASMQDNIDKAFEVVPKTYDLLHEVPGAPLGRYDLHIINAIFGDVQDQVLLARSQAEMTIKIAEQLRLMVPSRDGGDIPEDPQYGIFGGAYLTRPTIVKAGLKTYDFTVTDAPGRDYLDPKQLVRVYGDEVWDKVKLNGFKVDKDELPTIKDVVEDLKKRAHAFVIQIRSDPTTTRFWTEIYGKNRVITVPSVDHLPEIEAAICGLTEGTLNLQNIEQFLIQYAQTSKSEALMIKNAVSKIPLGAQAKLPNFNKLPKKGDIFRTKDDVWPIGHELSDEIGEAAKPGYTPNKHPKKESAGATSGSRPPGWL